jgi:glycerol-3-phosphate acyltransferase PlsX
MSIGEEDEKGNQLTVEAHELLRTADLNFAGNTEGRTLLDGSADVIVADGFTATSPQDGRGHRQEPARRAALRARVPRFAESLRSTDAPAARRLRTRLDPETYGGGYLLGLNGLVVIAHGSSSRIAVANAIRLGARGVEHRVVERLQERLSPAC